MKLLHYFITERNYNPVVVHGIQNEIWLENMNEEFKIVRIVMNYIHNKEMKGEQINKNDICASFQSEAFDELIAKTIRASKMLGEKYNKIVIAGGVSANCYLRDNMKERAKKENLEVYFPKISLCTDNAAMIASAGYYNFVYNENLADLTLSPIARIDL